MPVSPLPSTGATAADIGNEVADSILGINGAVAGGVATRVDSASATITYVGVAAPGTLDASASWQVFRIDTSTIAAEILFADGDTAADNIWDNRAALSYS